MEDTMWSSSSPECGSAEDCYTDEAEVVKFPKSTGNKSKNSSCKVNRCKSSRSRSKMSKTSPVTLQWLEENYEISDGVCLPRSVLYNHYQDFCKRNAMEPVGAASFGKVIRQKFPNITTRRLGTRGQSKYHYYGIGIKETSIYFRSAYSKRALTRFSGANCIKKEGSQSFLPAKTGILLTGFPKVKDLKFSADFPSQKLETFMIMYQTHCQRVLDTVVRANFEEVQDFFIHFWQGMPTHMLPILGCQATINLITVCDCILYRTLGETLIPSNLQPLPESLAEDLKNFSVNITEWLLDALEDLPAQLGIRKMHVADLFGRNLRRQLSLVQMTQATRNVLRSSEQVNDMLGDWRELNFVEISKMSVFVAQQNADADNDLIREVALEMEQLFVKQSPLEVYFEWLDSVIEKKVCNGHQQGFDLQTLCQNFLLSWTFFVSKVEKEMTLNGSPSFSSFRMLFMLLSEYVLYVLEMLQQQNTESQYEAMLSGKVDEYEGSNTIEEVSIGNYTPVAKSPPFTTTQSHSAYQPQTQVQQQQQQQQQNQQHQLQQQLFTMNGSLIKQEFQQDCFYPQPPPPPPVLNNTSPHPPPQVVDTSPNSCMDFSIPQTPRSSFSSFGSDVAQRTPQTGSPLATSPMGPPPTTEEITSPTVTPASQKMFSIPFTHEAAATTTPLPSFQDDPGMKVGLESTQGVFSDMEYKHFDPFMECQDPLFDNIFNYGYEWNGSFNMDTGHFMDAMPSPFLQSPISIV